MGQGLLQGSLWCLASDSIRHLTDRLLPAAACCLQIDFEHTAKEYEGI